MRDCESRDITDGELCAETEYLATPDEIRELWTLRSSVDQAATRSAVRAGFTGEAGPGGHLGTDCVLFF